MLFLVYLSDRVQICNGLSLTDESIEVNCFLPSCLPSCQPYQAWRIHTWMHKQIGYGCMSFLAIRR